MNEITAGLALRKKLRHYFMREDILFKEDKGWFVSSFFFEKVSKKQQYELEDWIKRAQSVDNSK